MFGILREWIHAKPVNYINAFLNNVSKLVLLFSKLVGTTDWYGAYSGLIGGLLLLAMIFMSSKRLLYS